MPTLDGTAPIKFCVFIYYALKSLIVFLVDIAYVAVSYGVDIVIVKQWEVINPLPGNINKQHVSYRFLPIFL